ncbi:MAG TPA: hypothetical protein VGO07_03795 [Candidatus Saccharimonadales bacterium]|jgi:phosphoribosylaminoimidazolecarboxamide formyltransferase/IMP cyclohydrolase|nr:hypothetical protein [Candidatus Saccharimonadales bacterium]
MGKTDTTVAVAKNALLSVYDKAGIAEFAAGLAKDGWRIYASGGTAKAVAATGVEVHDVTELVGGEAILGHRVVTLSREIHAGILADDSDEHTAELQRLNIPRISLVCVDMYPLQAAIADPAGTERAVVEMTDIGGPTMLRAAAKGRRIVLSRPEQRAPVLAWLQAGKPDEQAFLRELAAIAEYETARYVLTSARYLGGDAVTGFTGKRVAVPRYGENPWQTNAALYADDARTDPLALSNFVLRGGTELSFTNYTDVDRLLQTMTHAAAVFAKNSKTGAVPAIALGCKHGNMCGAGVATKPAAAIQKMLKGDPRAIFGGAVMLNTVITKDLANELLTHGMSGTKRLLDVVVAAGIEDDALAVLQRKGGKLRVIVNPALGGLTEDSLDTAPRFRYVRGGILQQDNYTFVFDIASPELERHGKALTAKQIKDMQLAWAVGSTSNSNTITLVKDGRLIGNGVGQQDRVSAAELAVKRTNDAGHDPKGAIAYSDSFFPFPDGPLKLADAGVAAILASRGSVRDGDVAKALTDAGVTFWTLPDTTIRGFFNH